MSFSSTDDENETNCKICGDYMSDVELEDYNEGCNVFCNRCSNDEESDEEESNDKDEPKSLYLKCEEIKMEEIYIDNTDKIWCHTICNGDPSFDGKIFDPDTSEEHPKNLTINDLVKHNELVEAFDENGMREIPFYKTK